MIATSGDELEIAGESVFDTMGLACYRGAKQARLIDLEPSGSHSAGEHLEIDYLIPFRNTRNESICLIGEITSRSRSNNVRKKYQKFRDQFDLIRRSHKNKGFWTSIGVPDEGLADFERVVDFRAFFILTDLEKMDAELPTVDNIVCIYKADWELLQGYTECIESYSLMPFLALFDFPTGAAHKVLQIGEENHSLMRITSKYIADKNKTAKADLYTFDVSPYEILPFAHVYRRDMLPTLSSNDHSYQRPLIPQKLNSIRTNLLTGPDFVFPNSILVVLSDKCSYKDHCLTIPDVYNSFAVIDGQHRLFSYANREVNERVGNDCKIMVTAIQFRDSTQEQVMRYSARTFVEINMNQTSIKKDHLHAIAYDILGETYPDALAAKVLLAVNTMSGKAKGLFDTNQTGLGIIQTKTVITALKVITNLESIAALSKVTKSAKRQQRRQGFINLFDVATIDELLDHTLFVKKTANCLNQFFSNVESVFKHDWPSRDNENSSSFAYAKMIAGLVKLLDQFISEGLTWQDIALELANIKANVMGLRKMKDYDDILFLTGHEGIPDSRPSYNENFSFLNSNRSEETSIQEILLKE